jgi:uncharacterized RDD family membrane protein YckC
MEPQADPTAVMGRRIVAYLIDSLLISGIFIAVMALTKDHAYTGAPSGACQTLRDGGFSGQCAQFGSRVYTWKSGGAAAGYGISVLAGFLDLVLLQGIAGASIGKLILSLRVVNAQGEPCGVGRAFVRWLLLIVDGACFLVGLLVALLTRPHRRVGDLAAGTYVVALAYAGRPIPGAQPSYQAAAPYQYAYPQQGAPGWAPPGTAPPPPPPPTWGTTPPAWDAPAPAAPPAWGAPPPAPPAWGTQSPLPPPPAWGAPPPAPPSSPAPPAWSGPTPTPPPPVPPPPAPEPSPAAPSQGQGDAAPAETPAPPPPPAEGESWWNKAFDEGDESEK